MPTSHNLPYVRFVRRASTATAPLTQFVARMSECFDALKAASWSLATTPASDTCLPLNDPAAFALSDKYDAFKACYSVVKSGWETVHMGMAAYRFKIPADAISDSTSVSALLVSIGADKFAYSGLRVSAILSNSATPPTDWALLRAGGEGTTADATGKFASHDATVGGVVCGVLNSRAYPNVADASSQAANVSLDLSAVTADYTYLYVVVSMHDYTDYRANRQYWVEGAGLVNGASVLTTFSASVDADSTTVFDGWHKLTGKYFCSVITPYYAQSNVGLLQTGSSPITPASVDEVLAAYPIKTAAGTYASAETWTQFAGAVGATVGLDTGLKVYGAYLWRLVAAPDGAAFTSLKFGADSVIDLSACAFGIRMNVWLATLDPSVATSTFLRLKQTAAGIQQYALWRGTAASTVSVTPEAYSGSAWADATALSFAKLGSFDLKSGKAYTSSNIFPVAVAGGGLKMLLVTLLPNAYSGTVGSATKATFTPGEFLYLQ